MTSRLRSLALASAAVAALCAVAAADAAATTLAALTGDRTLVLIDVEKRRVTKRVTIALTGGGRVAAIDVRTSDGRLYGLVEPNRVVTINPRNGSTQPKPNLSEALPSTQISADFNPVVDRLRVVGSDDSNLRIDVDTGTVTPDPTLTFVAPNPFGGTSPAVAAAAYSNNFVGAKATLLYDIDDPTSALHLQLPANNGTLVGVGELGVDLPATDIGFDIRTDSKRRNRGYLVSDRRLWLIDLAGGMVTSQGRVQGLNEAVRDVAVLPSP